MIYAILYLLSIPVCFITYVVQHILECRRTNRRFAIGTFFATAAASLIPILNLTLLIILVIKEIVDQISLSGIPSSLEDSFNDLIKKDN